jgi:hypothetical protein
MDFGDAPALNCRQRIFERRRNMATNTKALTPWVVILTSVETVAAGVAGALLLAAFISWERRAREPMLPIEFFRSRGFSAGNAAIFFQFASLMGAVFFFAQLLQVGQGYGPLGAGLRLVPWTATFITIATRSCPTRSPSCRCARRRSPR